ncbi:hypothetical protein GGF46_002888 [Coemansia sp. RSA 552]|nr:hypothetical protein GGF46_002888 [Coemansia sp. RSA 552]
MESGVDRRAGGRGARRRQEDQRRAEMRASLQTREQYDKLWMQWHLKLLAPVSEQVLQQAARYLTPEDFDGVVEERAGSDLCGYPLCNRKAQQLKQRYHISLARRKVFDISEQVNYCSGRCMAGARFFRHQLPEDPIYMRGRNQTLHIDVLPLDSKEVPRSKADDGPAWKRSGEGEVSDALERYRKKQMDKMNIPEAVATNNPLTIVEHSPESARPGIEEDMARLSFADVEGFKPKIDAARIKTDIRRAQGIAAAKPKARPGPKAEEQPSDAEVLRITVDGKEPKAQWLHEAQSSHSSEYGSSGDSDSDSDEGETAASDTGYFKQLFPNSTQRGMPTLSLFGRMWTLVDRIATKSTAAFLRDLGQTDDVSALYARAAEYRAAPGDQAMATRQGLLADGVLREIDGLWRKMGVALVLTHEVQILVSTLELDSNMAVFGQGELQLLGLVVVLALTQADPGIRRAVDGSQGAQELDATLKGLGSDRSLLGTIAQRLGEA